MALQSKQDLKDYILKRLGSPVINIEIDDGQLDDRIDDAIDKFLEYHYDGYEELFIAYETKQADEDRGYFVLDDDIISVLEIMEPDDYTSGEQLDNIKFQFWQNAHKSGVARMDMQEWYLMKRKLSTLDHMFNTEVSFEWNGVTKRLRPHKPLNVEDYYFDVQDVTLSPSTVTIRYDHRSYLEQGDTVWIEESTNNNGEYTVENVTYNESPDESVIELQENLSVESPADGKLHFKVGNLVVFHAYKSIDPETDVNIYNDEFIKKYASALAKQQWGSNIKKFKGMKMPGNVELDGQSIFDEATKEIENLEEEFQLRYEEPPGFFTG